MTVIVDFLNGLNGDSSASEWSLFGFVICGAIALAPAVATRTRLASGKRWVPVYGRTFIVFTLLMFLLNSVALVMPRECVRPDGNKGVPAHPWCDLELEAAADPYTAPSPPSATAPEVDWKIQNFSAAVVLAITLLAFLSWLLIGLVFHSGFVARDWARNPRGQPKTWLRILGWASVFALVALMIETWLVATPLGSMGEDHNSVQSYIHADVLPIAVWTACAWSLVFLVGLLVCWVDQAVEAVADEAEAHTPRQPRVGLSRSAWEAFMVAAGFELRRAVVPTPARGPAQVVGLGAGTTSDSAVYAVRKRTNASRTAYPFKAMIAPDFEAGCWLHQRQFIEAIEKASHAPTDEDPSAVLMHVAHSSGKSTAVYEATGRQVLDLVRHVLIVYPNVNHARRGLARFRERVRSTRQADRLKVGWEDDARSSAPPPIIVASADWLARTLMPEHETHAPFLSQLGLIVYEDIEALSGVRATNLAIVTRRLFRLLAHHPYDRRPVLGMTLAGVAQVEKSGAEEYAKWLAGPCNLVEAANRNEAPNAEIHLYMLERSPGQTDAERKNLLPPVAQLAWMSRKFEPEGATAPGCPVHMHRIDMVTESDLKKPSWAGEPIDLRDETAVQATGRTRPDANLTEGSAGLELDADMGKAWVHVRETALRGFFSLPEHVQHGGVQLLPALEDAQDGGLGWDGPYESTDHLVVLVPGMRCRAFLQYLTRHWLASAERSAPRDGQVRQTPWDRDFLELGSRLICGEPRLVMLRKHILAALKEKPATRPELEDIFPWDFDIASVLGWLERSGQLSRERTRILHKTPRDEWVVDDPWVYSIRSRDSRDLRTHLDAVGDRVAYLTERASRTESGLLQTLDRLQILRRAYPGKLFFVNGRRYRVLPERFPDAFAQLRELEDLDQETTLEQPLWVICQNEDVLAYTEACVDRGQYGLTTMTKPDRGATGGISEEFVEDGGVPIRMTRVDARYRHHHLGYYEYRDTCKADRLERTWVKWSGEPLSMWMRSSCLLVNVSKEDAPLSEAAAVTLRRMLSPALSVLVHLDPETLDIDVLASWTIGSTASQAASDSTDGAGELANELEVEDKHTGILLMDPSDGGSGLLEALGPSPRRFVIEQLFKLVWLWADDLASDAAGGREVTWHDIGTLNIRSEDDTFAPDVGGVRDFLSAVLGRCAQRFDPVEAEPWADRSEGVEDLVRDDSAPPPVTTT